MDPFEDLEEILAPQHYHHAPSRNRVPARPASGHATARGSSGLARGREERQPGPVEHQEQEQQQQQEQHIQRHSQNANHLETLSELSEELSLEWHDQDDPGEPELVPGEPQAGQLNLGPTIVGSSSSLKPSSSQSSVSSLQSGSVNIGPVVSKPARLEDLVSELESPSLRNTNLSSSTFKGSGDQVASFQEDELRDDSNSGHRRDRTVSAEVPVSVGRRKVSGADIVDQGETATVAACSNENNVIESLNSQAGKLYELNGNLITKLEEQFTILINSISMLTKLMEVQGFRCPRNRCQRGQVESEQAYRLPRVGGRQTGRARKRRERFPEMDASVTVDVADAEKKQDIGGQSAEVCRESKGVTRGSYEQVASSRVEISASRVAQDGVAHELQPPLPATLAAKPTHNRADLEVLQDYYVNRQRRLDALIRASCCDLLQAGEPLSLPVEESTEQFKLKTRAYDDRKSLHRAIRLDGRIGEGSLDYQVHWSKFKLRARSLMHSARSAAHKLDRRSERLAARLEVFQAPPTPF